MLEVKSQCEQEEKEALVDDYENDPYKYWSM